MIFKNPMLVVGDMEKSKEFYRQSLGLRVIADLGAHVVLTGGLALQTQESWHEFINQPVTYKGNDAEMYFEEDDFEGLIEKLKTIETIEYVHPPYEHRWGQKVVRIYDPDHHIIEVGENLKIVCKRFLDSGLTEEETAERMDVPIRMVKGWAK